MQVSVPPLLQSKKFIASALASLISLAGYQYGLDERQIGMVIAPLLLYVATQGLADVGKSKAQVEHGKQGHVIIKNVVNQANET